MGIVTDTFNQNAFEVIEFHEEVVKNIEHKPELLGSLNLFEPINSRSKTIAIAKKGTELTLIPTSERGSPPEELIPLGADVRTFDCSRIAKGSTIYADELQGVANLPLIAQTKEITQEVSDRSAQIKDDFELTFEHMRLGAIQGVVYDSDGTTVLHDWYSEWGITPPTEINFELNTATTDVRKKCRDLGRAMQKAAKGVWTSKTRIGALVGDDFFDKLVDHAQIKETKVGTSRAKVLEDLEGYSSIDIENITFINYRGTDDDTKLAIGSDKARFFPINARGAFKVGYGPASEFKPYTNQRGQELVTLILHDPSGREAWDRVEMYSWPLFMCTRPAMLMRGKAQ